MEKIDEVIEWILNIQPLVGEDYRNELAERVGYIFNESYDMYVKKQMPYIKQQRRREVAIVLDTMDKAKIKADGDLNYILFSYCKYSIEPSYNNYKNFCGELRQCATEIEREILAPYEDLKKKENGKI